MRGGRKESIQQLWYNGKNFESQRAWELRLSIGEQFDPGEQQFLALHAYGGSKESMTLRTCSLIELCESFIFVI